MSQQQQSQSHLISPGVVLENHIPGYAGYIPSVKSENMFARTYGDLTQIVRCNVNSNQQYITKSTGDEVIDCVTQKYAFVFEQSQRAQNRQR